MSDQDQWCIATDESFSVGEKALSGLEYHQKLNILLVTSEDSGILIYDSTSSTLLKKTDAAGINKNKLTCHYVNDKDGVIVSDGTTINVRKDLNGMYLLDTSLCRKIESVENDTIKLEITLTDAESLVNAVQDADILKVDRMEEIMDKMKQLTKAARIKCRDNQKLAKWSTIVLEYPQSVLLYVFQHIMVQLKSKSEVSPALPVASALTERSSYFATDYSIDTPVPLDRSLMYSEAARLATFKNWPHMGYQWAKPESMSRAGFYHEPTSTNDDRSMCFTCNVCLVCWERTDEPWSEHERHQPNCPYIKGSPTQNVPLSVYYASQPAIKCEHKLLSSSKAGEDVYLAALMPDCASVKMWTMGRQLDLCREIILTPQPGTAGPVQESSAHSGTVDDMPLQFRVTAMSLLCQETRRTGLVLVTGAICNQIIQLSVYNTGCETFYNQENRKVEIEASLAAAFGSPEQLEEAILLEQQYLVSEPPKDPREHDGVVVASTAKPIQSLQIPEIFRRKGYMIKSIEPSLDKTCLLVYLSVEDPSKCPASMTAGALLLYQIEALNGLPTINEQPSIVRLLEKPADLIVSMSQLSLDFTTTRETGEEDEEGAVYHMMVTRRSGQIGLMNVKQLKEIIKHSSDQHKFLHSVYCTGIDRICATTTQGNIVMLQVNPVTPSIGAVSDDMVNNPKSNASLKEIHDLFEAPLTVENLNQLSELTECENLTGKFTATLPSCWQEVQQEQHQRKHPQHLQQSLHITGGGASSENTSVSRTWRLMPEGDTGTREHVIELSLPKISSIGHVEVRYTLRPSAHDVPDVKLALLCYKLENRNMGMKLSSSRPLAGNNSSPDTFLPQSFLDKHNLELLCAPVSFMSGTDVSGQSGIITLTSPALLKIKPRSLVIYMKHSTASKTDSDYKKDKMFTNIESSLFPQPRSQSDSSSGSSGRSSSPRNAGGMRFGNGSNRGMDLVDEISISVRKTKTTSIQQERVTRLAMLEHKDLHRGLVEVSYKGVVITDETAPLLALEHNRVCAMRLLAWIASLQMNDVTPRTYDKTILEVVATHLDKLVENCLISGTRSTSHAFTRLLTVCTELSRRLGDKAQIIKFSNSMLDSLLVNMNKLKESVSSGALQAYFLLLGRVKSLDTGKVSLKVCELLVSLSHLYRESFSDPVMSRLSRYGLTSSPYDSEVFDSSLPLFVSQSAVMPGSTYASATSQKAPPKEEIPTSVDLTDPSSQALTAGEQLNLRVSGLLEVEPLQFSINSYSEYIHVTHGNNPNVTPVFYGSGSTNAPDPASLTEGLPINVPQTAGSIALKKIQQLKKTVGLMKGIAKTAKSEMGYPSGASFESLAGSLNKGIKGAFENPQTGKSTKYVAMYPVPTHSNIQPVLNPAKAKQNAAQGESVPDATKLAGSVAGTKSTQSIYTAPYPSIQAILQPPNEFTLVAGRMISSGNTRRFIVLDFGQPIRLTDVVIPACADLTSLAIDVWLEGEALDAQRVVVCTDIGTKCLVLSDIQPACVCRFVKITYAPKSNGSGQTYRIPLGVFYGHAYVFPWETSSNIMALRTPEEVWRQITVYSSAAEDIRCCYKLACGRLRQLLQNTDNQSLDMEKEENEQSTQVQQAHEECLKLQHQLNLANNAIKRLRGVLPAATQNQSSSDSTASQCRDKLRYIIEALLSVLVNRPSKDPIPRELYSNISADVAKQLFINLGIHGNRRIQLLTGNLIVQVCSGQNWYGQLFEQILLDVFKSSNTNDFPKLKVFGLLVSMAHRSLQNGRRASQRVCGNVLELLSSQLTPLSVQSTPNTPASFVDMELVSWLLLFISRLTDANFDLDDPLVMDRWDFLASDAALCKKKLFNRISTRAKAKQERTQLAMRKRFNLPNQPIVPSRSGGGGVAARHREKMMMQRHMMMRNERDIMRMRRLEMEQYADPRIRRRMMMMMRGDPDFDAVPPVRMRFGRKSYVVLERSVVMPVVRGLLSLVLRANFSCHTDLFILACKVSGRLAQCARPTLKLGEVLTADQLKKLMTNITHIKFNGKSQAFAGQWGKHSLMCVVGDIVEGERAQLDVIDNDDDPEDFPDASGSSGGASSESSSSGPSRTPPSSRRDPTAGLKPDDPLVELLHRYSTPSFPDVGYPGGGPGSSSSGGGPGPGGGGPGDDMRSIDLLRMMQRDEMREMMMDPMLEEMMDMDMEMDMMYGAEMDDIMMQMAYMHAMGPRGFPGPRQGGDMGPPMMNAILTPVSSAIDSRPKYCCDAAAEHRLQLWAAHELSNQQRALSSKHNLMKPNNSTFVRSDGFTQASLTEISSGVSAPHIEDTMYTQNGNEALTTEEFLSSTFSDLISTEGANLDYESLLQFYIALIEEWREDTREGFDPALKPFLPLSTQSIEALVTHVATGRALGSKGWTLLLRVLTLQLNSNLNEDDRAFALTLCASDVFQKLLKRFLRCSGNVGPSAVKAFEDLLTRIQIVHQSASENLNSLSEMLLVSLSKIMSDSAARGSLYGALDAQLALVEFIVKLPANSAINANILSLFESAVKISKEIIDIQETVVPNIDAEDSEMDVTVCFQQVPSKNKDVEMPPTPDSTESRLITTLLKLLSNILRSTLPSTRPATPPGAAGRSGAETDNTKLSQQRGASAAAASASAAGEGTSAGTSGADSRMDTEESPQTDEQKRGEGETISGTSGQAKKRKCLHLMDVDAPATLADSILSNRQLVTTLIQALSQCRSSSLKPKSSIKQPITVGDAVFNLLTLLFRTSTDYYKMLELLQEYLSSTHSVYTVSAPLLLFIKVTLNCEHTISRFIELDGINCIVNRFVESYSSYPDESTGMISSVLYHLSSTGTSRPNPNSINLSQLVMSSSSNESLINFAPLGNIYSNNPSVGPTFALIQANPAHRRARTAPWNYKFSADQPWIDLCIQLPCAVLVKEIQIHPYLNTLNTAGPSHISVELSHDGLPTLPARNPIITSGLTVIKVKLIQPEVVSCVSIRIHRPRDSLSLGLSQICILGYPGLCEPGSVPQKNNTSYSWLQLLYHCIDYIPDMSTQVLDAIQSKCDVLHTCCSLLMSQLSSSVTSQLEKVIIELSVRSADVSKILIDRLLRQNHSDLLLINSQSMATDATAEILYRIGLHQDSNASIRIAQFLRWLEDCAVYACRGEESRGPPPPGVVRPSRLHVQCVASTLWSAAETNTFDVKSLFSDQLFLDLLSWSLTLSQDKCMKLSVDSVIAAICHIDIRYYQILLQKFFLTPLATTNQTEILLASVSDDAKDDIQQEMLTDERKEHCRFIEEVLMDDQHLTLLATASQPAACAQSLIDSPILRVLSQAITEFCLKQLQHRGDPEAQTAAAGEPQATRQGNSVCITWKSLPVILTFFKQCAAAHTLLKQWMGSPEGVIFWAPLLELFSSNVHTYTARNDLDQGIESSVVAFFKTVTLNHTVNQLAFSEVLCNLLRVIASMPNSVAGSSLSSFLKNLILQTLLEDEKIFVTVTSHGLNYSFTNNNSTISPRHLGVGVGHSTKTVHVSIYDSMEKLAELITRQDKAVSKSLSSKAKPSSAMSKIEYAEQMAELGLIYPGSVMDYDDLIYTALSSGESAKVKRDKKSKSSSTQTDQSKIKGSTRKIQFLHPHMSDKVLSGTTTLADLMGSLLERGLPMGSEHIHLQIYSGKEPVTTGLTLDTPVDSTLKVFTGQGGLALLAEHLPLLYPEITQQTTKTTSSSGGGATETASELSDQDYEFVTQVKGISLGDIQYETSPGGANKKGGNTKKTATGPTSIPPHSLIAFGLFLRLPGYAEMLIKQRLKAKCLLRLVLGARDDGEGLAVLASPVASSLPTLPFTNLKLLYQSSQLTTDDGMMLRKTSMQIGALHLVLACLSALSHHKPRRPTKSAEHEELTNAATLMAIQVMGSASSGNGNGGKKTGPTPAVPRREEQSGQQYWAKGTGFGTGSTTTQWDLEQSLLKQQGEEEHVTCMLDIISSMINPEDNTETSTTTTSAADTTTSLPTALCDRLRESCLLPAIASYLRNDSVLDMSRHVPLYQSVYRLLRALSSSTHLVSLLREPVKDADSATLQTLTANMERCVATYKSRLRPSSKTPATGPASSAKSSVPSAGPGSSVGGSGNTPDKTSEEEDQANSLNELAVVLTNTHKLLTAAVEKYRSQTVMSPTRGANQKRVMNTTPKQTYEELLKLLQFDTFKFVDMSTSAVKLLCHHHYEMSIRQANTASGNNARTRRLAQEAVTLSTSLPLSASSSVFVRCDEERMDVMKVLITGPSDTPYMNGCFEFDVFFPADYPNSPPLINLQTTGNHKVRFNPNLYNDGKVCLSVLNTWHGRPEEKWNAQTSSFLQVLVSIQSLILVCEPYFNEPGYERSRGTPAGTANCREYDSNIRQATVKYAMLEMIKNPSPCFKEIIQKHFWMKRNEIKEQIELWLTDQSIPDANLPASKSSGAKAKSDHTIAHNSMLLKKHYQQLLAEFDRMKRPEGVDEDEVETVPSVVSTAMDLSLTPTHQPVQAEIISSTIAEPSSTSTTSIDDNMSYPPPFLSNHMSIPDVDCEDGMDDAWMDDHGMSSGNSSEMMDVEESMLPPQHYEDDLTGGSPTYSDQGPDGMFL